MPYLYKIMDRTQDALNMTLGDIQGTGAKPIKLTSKKVFKFVPNWCSSGLTTYTIGNLPNQGLVGSTSMGLRAQYAWLATPNNSSLAPNIGYGLVPIDTRDPVSGQQTGMNTINCNQVCYNGMDVYIDQNINVGNPTVARLIATVTWQFKDPKFNAFVRDPPPLEPPVELKV